MEYSVTTVDIAQVSGNEEVATQMMDSYCDDLRATWISAGHMTNDAF